MGDTSLGFVVLNSTVTFQPPLKCCVTLASLNGEQCKVTNT